MLLEDRWLLSRLATVTQQVTDALENYRYADAARMLYDFAWNEFCSFYVEMTKARFGVSEQRETAQRVLAHALDVLMRLLHPMMPFLTEEVWQLLAQVAPKRGLDKLEPSPSPSLQRRGKAAESICIAAWPAADTALPGPEDRTAIRRLPSRARRRPRSPPTPEYSVQRRTQLHRPLRRGHGQTARTDAAILRANGPRNRRGIRPSRRTRWRAHQHHARRTTGPIEVHVDVSRFIDVAAERKRLEKDRDNLAKQIKSIEAKLANKAFVDKAPAEVVQQQRRQARPNSAANWHPSKKR